MRRPFTSSVTGAVTGAAVIALTLPTLLYGQSTDRYTLRGNDVAVYDPAGRVQVVAGSGSDVVVEVTRRGRDAARLRVLTGEARGQNALRVVAPAGELVYPEMGRNSSTSFRVRSDGTFGDDDGGLLSMFSSDRLTIRGEGRGPEAWADLVVQVPAGRRLGVHTGVGTTTVQNVDGDLTLGAQAGNITAERTRGRLTVGTGSGDVRLRDVQGGDMRVGTGSGDLDVRDVHAEQLKIGTGSGDVRGGDLDARDAQLGTGSGDLRLDQVRARTLRLTSGSGSADVALAGDVQQANVSSGSGDITLRVPPTFGATLDASTGSGDVHSELPLQLTRLDAHHLTGRLGDGRAQIRVSTGSGEVKIVGK